MKLNNRLSNRIIPDGEWVFIKKLISNLNL